MAKISYPRAPSEALQKLLLPGRYLAPVIDLNRRKFRGMELDVHFRTGNEVHVYYGQTRILTVKLLSGPARQLSVDAYSTYKAQDSAEAAGVFRQWKVGEPGFSEAIEAYLDGVEVNSRFTEREGAVQSQWAGVTEPWVPFDREAELKYEFKGHWGDATQFAQVESAFERIQDEATKRDWKKLRRDKKHRKVDQLAVDLEGRLVLIELKDARASDVYYVPFQLLQYAWEWHSALRDVHTDLRKLIRARAAVGLGDAPASSGGMRVAVGFGLDKRTSRVKCRYEIVLGIANDHLPPGVGSIETWEHTGGEARQVS